MFQQPNDFRDESLALYQLLAPLVDADFERKTLFKDWTVHDVLSHLHAWNRAADLSLNDPEKFDAFKTQVISGMMEGKQIRELESVLLDDAKNRARFEQWNEYIGEMTQRFAAADPKKRVAWPGPDMSVRSSITARLMETWAHGQELYDLLGVVRTDGDRIKNIAVLGINTFGWTFKNRRLEVPSDLPYVRLSAPSGETWTWNEPSESNCVAGSASDFCQVVTQVRNIADTKLEVVGETAVGWMAIAQCFAGAPADPPAKGARFTARKS
ncbi:MAG: hypothetical protein ACI8TX_000670 [Hyphomicrobiaceae bacterium]